MVITCVPAGFSGLIQSPKDILNHVHGALNGNIYMTSFSHQYSENTDFMSGLEYVTDVFNVQTETFKVQNAAN